MTIKYHKEVEQGSDEWFAMRCGILTASEVKLIITPTLKVANNDKTRSHVYEIASQRITEYVEPTYVSDDMLRGHDEEILAREKYREEFAEGEVSEVGFITNDHILTGTTIGYSPDGIVGDDGLIECKSRKQKYQLETILSKGMPDNSSINCMLQIQTGLLVSERKWCDFISYSGGMPMFVHRVYPDKAVQAAIYEAAFIFEQKVREKISEYNNSLLDESLRMVETERTIQDEITV